MSKKMSQWIAIALAGLIVGGASGVCQASDHTNWPSFRGPQASGIATGADIPTHWDPKTGENIAWRTVIPGLGFSSPVVWGKQVFITSAISQEENPLIEVGLYGDIKSEDEEYVHHYKLYCLDRTSGNIEWEKTAYSGVPKVKRHRKSSHATCTPTTDGTHVIAFFGSQGLYCYDMDGALKWKKDLGVLDAGFFAVPEAQWGFGSSPIIHNQRVIVLCDVNNQSFIASFDVETGNEEWRTLRDEVPTWGTPTVVEYAGKTQVIVNGYKHIGGYDLETGESI